MKVRNRETGEIMDAEIADKEWSRSIGPRGVTRAQPGDYILSDSQGEKWGVRAAYLPLMFETLN